MNELVAQEQMLEYEGLVSRLQDMIAERDEKIDSLESDIVYLQRKADELANAAGWWEERYYILKAEIEDGRRTV